MEMVKVEVEKFKTTDGRLFDTQTQALDHELRMNGSRKTCPRCEGKGEYIDKYEYMPRPQCCDKCGGKGYLDKQMQVVEVWS